MLQVVGEHLVPLPLFDEGIRDFEHLGKRFRAVTGAGVDPCVAAVRQDDGEDHHVVRQDLARDRRHAVEHLGQVGRIDQLAQQLVEQFERCRSRPEFLRVPGLIGKALMRQRQCNMVRKAPGHGDIGELILRGGPRQDGENGCDLSLQPNRHSQQRLPTGRHELGRLRGVCLKVVEDLELPRFDEQVSGVPGQAVWRGRFRRGRAGHRIRDDVFSIIGQEQNRDRVVRKNPAGDLRHAREHLAQIEDGGKRRERFVHDSKSPQARQFRVGMVGRLEGSGRRQSQRPQRRDLAGGQMISARGGNPCNRTG